ncbi:MAG TPA: ribbon-helix-helix protein, CopG family [Streptosporangiaceae bacterium]|nr:ribbon-helix-helix protein, CopG family [Streptosporangiaceae bacterium]
MAKQTKNMVLRLDPALAERLQLIAEVEGRSVSDVARQAIAELVERRRKDRRFLRLLDDNLTRHAEALRLLRDEPAGPGRQRGAAAPTDGADAVGDEIA